MRARVSVTLKPSVFDPQGKTIADALQSLGYAGVEDVRQGKFFELDLKTTESTQAKALAAEVADKLLANPVIESYRDEVDSAAQPCLRQSALWSCFRVAIVTRTPITLRSTSLGRKPTTCGTRTRT